MKKGNSSSKKNEQLDRNLFRSEIRDLREELNTERKNEWITTASLVASILGLGAGVFTLFSSFSNPNVLASPGMSPINWNLWIGIGLLLIGLVAGFFWMKRRK